MQSKMDKEKGVTDVAGVPKSDRGLRIAVRLNHTPWPITFACTYLRAVRINR